MTTAHPYDFSTVPPQNTIIFEPETDLRKNSRSQPAGTYLGDILKYCPHGSGEAVVTKMEYRKMGPKNAFHEFLLCYVEDKRKIHGRVAVITIERCGVVDAPRKPQEGEPRSSSTSVSSSSSKPSGSLCGIAEDKFTITCAPEVKPIDSQLLSTLHFHDSSLVVEELAVATRVASEVDKRYRIVTNQCLWFALLIWNIICHVKDGNFCEVAFDKDKMGTFSGFPLLHHDTSPIFWFKAPGKLSAIISIYETQWNKWVLDIEAKKTENEAPAKELSEVRQEVEIERRQKLRALDQLAKDELQIEEDRREIKRQQEEIEMQRLEIKQQRKEILDLRADKPII